MNLRQAKSPVAPAPVPLPLPLLGWVAGLGLLIGLVCTVYTFLQRDGFNEDEIFQLVFVNEPMPTFFSLFLRLDQHPPFHYLQLVPWSMVSSSDVWMLLNSLVWHGVSCLVIWAVGRAWLGQSAGLLAAALFALMPQVVSSATTLRFYAMIPALAVLVWWLHVQLLSPRAQGARWWWALLVVQVALAYSHAIAFYFVFWLALAGALQQRAVVGRDAPWRRWLAVQAGVLVLVLPQVLLTLARAMMARGSGELAGGNNDAGGLIDHFGGMTAGWGMQWQWARVFGASLYLAALGLGLWRPATRLMAGVLLIGPYALATLIGLVLTPMFKTPVYSAMLVPFACLALAGGLVHVAGRWSAVPALALLAAMAAFVFPASAHLNRGISPYRTVAAEIKRIAQPGDVVVIAKPYLYWAVMRYAVAPNWGSPLEVLPPLSGSWLSLTQRLGQPMSMALKLVPRTNQIEYQGVTYVIGEDASLASVRAERVLVVERPRYPMPVRLAAGFADKGLVFQAGTPEVVEIHLHQR